MMDVATATLSHIGLDEQSTFMSGLRILGISTQLHISASDLGERYMF